MTIKEVLERKSEWGNKRLKAFLPLRPEWKELGGIETMMRNLSDFLVIPRIMAFALLPEEIMVALGLPRPTNMPRLLEKGRLEKFIEKGRAKIHKSSWLDYSSEDGWRSKGIAPIMVKPIDRFFPPRLMIYEVGYPPRRALICSFRPTSLDKSNMGRLGICLKAESQTVFIGEAMDEGLEITLPKGADPEMFRILRREPKLLSSYIEVASDFIKNQRRFNLDIWIPWQGDSGEIQSTKLFGAQFLGITLFEIIAGQK